MSPSVYLTIIFVTIAILWTADRADTRAAGVAHATLMRDVLLKGPPPAPQRPSIEILPGGGLPQRL